MAQVDTVDSIASGARELRSPEPIAGGFGVAGRGRGWLAPEGWNPFRVPISVNETLIEAAVGVDAPVAQERPVAPDFFDAAEVHVRDEDLFLVDRRFRDDHAE